MLNVKKIETLQHTKSVGGEGPSLDESVLIDSVHCSGDMLELARILHEVSNGAIRHTRICMYVYV